MDKQKHKIDLAHGLSREALRKINSEVDNRTLPTKRHYKEALRIARATLQDIRALTDPEWTDRYPSPPAKPKPERQTRN